MGKTWLHIALALVILGLAGPTPAADLGKGYILFEWFEGTAGGNVDQAIDGRNRNYPDNPHSFAWRNQFASPSGRGDNFVTRVRGYLYPPVDGDYTFWIRADDQGRLWLSTDEDPANKVMICETTAYTGATEWTKYATQKSSPIALKANKRYYIEAVHREGTGGDHVGVGWGGPAVIGAGPVIIDGQYLAAWIRPVDLMASGPDPANGAQGVDLAALKWTSGLMAIRHEVYFGTDPNVPFRKQVVKPEDFYLVEPGVTYYWRVDEIEPDGTKRQGALWSFTARPMNAWGPTPPDSARGVLTDGVLQWQEGMNAVEHDVFFGESKADVAAGAAGVSKGKIFQASLDVSGLKNDATYYWRVDETDWAGTKTQGAVWSFKTVPPLTISDPNLKGWWKLDESTGTAIDYSGYGNSGEIRGGAKPVAGFADGAIDFDGIDDFVFTGKSAVDLGIDGAKPRSVTAWVYTRAYNNGAIFDVGARTAGQDFCLRTRGGADQWRVQYQGATADFTYPSQNRWVHFALVFDGGWSTCYANGVVVNSVARTLSTVATNPFQIGRYGWPTNYFDGLIDDVRVYSKALSEKEVQLVFERAISTQAWGANPADGSVTDALKATPLTWGSGDDIVGHDVYLTTDAAVIADATLSDATGIYRGRVNVSSYLPDPGLNWNTQYYWRVDEVAADGSVTKGRIWSFTLTDWIIVDDFQGYNEDYMHLGCIYQTWIDGAGYTTPTLVAGNGSNAAVGHPTYDSLSPHYGGTTVDTRNTLVVGVQQRSMPLYYDNKQTPFYSETLRTWTTTQDWTLAGGTDLNLWVRGGRFDILATGQPPVIDGQIDAAWAAAQALPIGTLINGETPTGPEDASGQFRVLYDAANLYALVEINDEALCNDSATFHLDDSVEFYVDADNTKKGPGLANTNARQYNFGWNIKTTDTSEVGGTNTNLVGVEHAQANTATGWRLEIKLPWQSLTGFAIPAGGLIGFDCFYNDDDNGGDTRESQITWYSTTNNDWQTPFSWATGLLGQTPGADRLYVAVQDASNRKKVVYAAPGLLQTPVWAQWRIPFTEFTAAGVSMARVTKMTIGVDNPAGRTAGDSSVVFIDDISLTRPAGQ